MPTEIDSLDNVHRCIVCEKSLAADDDYGRSLRNNYLKYKRASEQRRKRLEAEWEGRRSKKSDDEVVVAATCGELFHKSCLMKYCSSFFNKSKGGNNSKFLSPFNNNNFKFDSKASCPRCKRHIMYSLHQEIDFEGHRTKGPNELDKTFHATRLTYQELIFQYEREIKKLEKLETSIEMSKAKLNASRKKQLEMAEVFPAESAHVLEERKESAQRKKREKRALEAYIEKAQKVIELMQTETPKVMRMYLGSVKGRPLDEIAGCTPIPRMLIPHLQRIMQDDYCLFALSQIVRPRPYPGTTFDFNSLITGILKKVNPSLCQKLSARAVATGESDLQKAYDDLYPADQCLEMLRSVREMAESEEEIASTTANKKKNSDLEITIMYVMDDEDDDHTHNRAQSESQIGEQRCSSTIHLSAKKGHNSKFSSASNSAEFSLELPLKKVILSTENPESKIKLQKVPSSPLKTSKESLKSHQSHLSVTNAKSDSNSSIQSVTPVSAQASSESSEQADLSQKLSNSINSLVAKLDKILSHMEISEVKNEPVDNAATDAEEIPTSSLQINIEGDTSAEEVKASSDSDSNCTRRGMIASTRSKQSSISTEMNFDLFNRQNECVFLDDASFAITQLSEQMAVNSNFDLVDSVPSKSDPSVQLSRENTDAAFTLPHFKFQKTLEESAENLKKATPYGDSPCPSTRTIYSNPWIFPPKYPEEVESNRENRVEASTVQTPKTLPLCTLFHNVSGRESPADFLDLKEDAANNNVQMARKINSELATSDIFVTVMSTGGNGAPGVQDAPSRKSIPLNKNLHLVAYGKSKGEKVNPFKTVQLAAPGKNTEEFANPLNARGWTGPQDLLTPWNVPITGEAPPPPRAHGPFTTTTYLSPPTGYLKQRRPQLPSQKSRVTQSTTNKLPQTMFAPLLPVHLSPPMIKGTRVPPLPPPPHGTTTGATSKKGKQNNPLRRQYAQPPPAPTLYDLPQPISSLRPNASSDYASRSRSKSKGPLKVPLYKVPGAQSTLLSNAELGLRDPMAYQGLTARLKPEPKFLLEYEKRSKNGFAASSQLAPSSKIISCRKAPSIQPTAYKSLRHQALGKAIPKLSLEVTPPPSRGKVEHSIPTHNHKREKSHNNKGKSLIKRSVKTLQRLLTPRKSPRRPSVLAMHGSGREALEQVELAAVGESLHSLDGNKKRERSGRKIYKNTWKTNPFSARRKKLN